MKRPDGWIDIGAIWGRYEANPFKSEMIVECHCDPARACCSCRMWNRRGVQADATDRIVEFRRRERRDNRSR